MRSLAQGLQPCKLNRLGAVANLEAARVVHEMPWVCMAIVGHIIIHSSAARTCAEHRHAPDGC